VPPLFGQVYDRWRLSASLDFGSGGEKEVEKHGEDVQVNEDGVNERKFEDTPRK
jgi:hypothetical protein